MGSKDDLPQLEQEISQKSHAATHQEEVAATNENVVTEDWTAKEEQQVV